MRIALDGRALTGRYTGDRTYWKNLIFALTQIDSENTYLIYSRTPIPPGELPEAPNLKPRVVEARNDRLWTLYALPRALRQDRADLVHVQYTAPLAMFCPCPIVTTVHDISFRLYPEWFPRKHRVLMNLTVPASMRRAAYVITDSESSRQDILRTYPLAESKVVAIPLGLPEGFAICAGESQEPEEQERARCLVKERYGVEKPFLLAVGVLQPRKNLETLAAAFGQLKSRHPLPHVLALVGKPGWLTQQEALRAVAVREGGEKAGEAVLFPGYVPDEDLPIWYRACAAFAHPALYEGFGFPPLEALACGAPALVSDAPAMPEVVGDAALIVSARDVDAWASALYALLTDETLRTALRERGPLRAARFSWNTTAQKTVAVYRAAVGAAPAID